MSEDQKCIGRMEKVALNHPGLRIVLCEPDIVNLLRRSISRLEVLHVSERVEGSQIDALRCLPQKPLLLSRSVMHEKQFKLTSLSSPDDCSRLALALSGWTAFIAACVCRIFGLAMD